MLSSPHDSPWPALNSLSIHVTFTAIVPGAYPGRHKCAKNVLKWRTFEITGWITGKELKIDGYMLRCVWQALNPLFIHVTFNAIVPGAYTGKTKMCLRLIAETDARSIGECDSHPSCKSLFGTCTLRAHSDTDNSSIMYKMIYALQYSTDRLRICICICMFKVFNSTQIQ